MVGNGRDGCTTSLPHTMSDITNREFVPVAQRQNEIQRCCATNLFSFFSFFLFVYVTLCARCVREIAPMGRFHGWTRTSHEYSWVIHVGDVLTLEHAIWSQAKPISIVPLLSGLSRLHASIWISAVNAWRWWHSHNPHDLEIRFRATKTCANGLFHHQHQRPTLSIYALWH